MILSKKLTAEEVCQALAAIAAETLPEGIEGKINVTLDEDGGAEIFVSTTNDFGITPSQSLEN